MADITCAGCSASRQIVKRLPKGWKHQGRDYWCGDCWRSRFILRAIVFPIVSPVDAKWAELRAAIGEMWRLTTQAANWMTTELYARDVRRNGEEKMPPMPQVYLYPEARLRFPALPSKSIAALEQSVQRKYRAKRYEVIWTCAAALPTVRYPQPFPVPNQAWSVEIEDERPVVRARIGERTWRLRLKGGARFQRQLAAVSKITSGEAAPGQLDIYQSGKILMAKIIAWLPRDREIPARENSSTLRVQTGADSLLTAFNEKDEHIWDYHADHVRRWSAEHSRTLRRLSDDQNAERRPDPRFARRRGALVAKHHNRMRSAVQEAAASVVRYASRRHFGAIAYDDRDHDFCDLFPWFLLRARLAAKCDEAGIAFEHVTGEAIEEAPELLAARD